MRGTLVIRLTVALGLLALTTMPVVAQQQGNDPVVEAARKAREQKKNEPKPKKVYTDDDISSHQGATEAAKGTAAANTEQAGTQQAAATAPGPAATENSEEAWRKRFQAQRDKITTAEKELDILQRELDQSQVQYYSDPQKALMQQNSREDINKKSGKIEQKKQEIAGLKAGLDDLEVQLRKSGGDPGWAR